MAPTSRKVLSLILPALLVGSVILFSWVLYWNGDAVLYQFEYLNDTEYFGWNPIRDWSTLWRSITRHYMEVNGRFVCHFIVMAVSSFMPQWLFAILNGVILALLLWMVCRLAGVKLEDWRGVWSVTLLGWLAYDNLTDTAFYINYIWMGALVVAWIWMFLRHPKVKDWVLVPVGLFSLIAGQAHECFAVPVGLALVVYLIEYRFRVSRFDWVAGLCFCIAGASTFLSPGLLVRMDYTVNEVGFEMPPRYDLLLESILPLMFVGVLIWYRKNLKDFFSSSEKRFWLWVIIGNLLLIFATLGRFGTRAFTIGSTGIIILSIMLWPNHRLNRLGMLVFALLTVWLIHFRWEWTFGLTDKYMYVREHYRVERPDTLWIPDEVYVIESRKTGRCENLEEHTIRRLWREEEDSSYLDKKRFIVLPECLRSIPRDFNGNLCRKLAPNVYLLVQSRNNPARFVSHKRFFPGVFDLELLPQRELVFDDDPEKFDIYLASNENWIAAFYTNEFVHGVEFDIVMIPPEDE